MARSTLSPATTSQAAVLHIDTDSPGQHRFQMAEIEHQARAGNDLLAEFEDRGVRLVAFAGRDLLEGGEDHDPRLKAMIAAFDADPALAIAVDAPERGSSGERDHPATPPPWVSRLRSTVAGPGGLPTVRQLADRLTGARGPRGLEGVAVTGPIVMVRVGPVAEVGGFDPTFPGFGWADLITRVLGVGWAVSGVDRARLPFVDELYHGLDPIDHFRSEARWLQLHGAPFPRSWPGALSRYRIQVLAACQRARSADRGPTAGQIRHRRSTVQREAARSWRAPPPHAVQIGLGERADWRFLLPSDHRRHTVIADGSAPAMSADRWHWLVEDGWTERVSCQPDPADPADVVVIGETQPIEPALDAVSPGGVICVFRPNGVLSGRRSAAGAGVVARLVEHGFDRPRRYLVLPGLSAPKRFVPLDHPAGLDWLLSPRPPAAAGRLSVASATRRQLARAGRSQLATLTGATMVVATRPAGRPQRRAYSVAGIDEDHWPPRTSDVIGLTSGFDEGSRVVLLPLSDGRDRPERAIKISSRPCYNANIDREVEVIRSIRQGLSPSNLVPDPSDPFTVGRLRATTESYAGRWRAADVLYEQRSLADRVTVLDVVNRAVTAFGRQSSTGAETWSSAAFEFYVGQWFDRFESMVGHSASLAALRAALGHRSDALTGTDLPLVARHYDLGPWNVVFDEQRSADRSPITIIDWELAPPRSLEPPGLAGADLVYFAKYWLHIAMGTRSVDDELTAFTFLSDRRDPSDPRRAATVSLRAALGRAGVDLGFVPILAAHVWAEAACYTMARRQDRGADPGSPGAYLMALARHRHRLLTYWPAAEGPPA